MEVYSPTPFVYDYMKTTTESSMLFIIEFSVCQYGLFLFLLHTLSVLFSLCSKAITMFEDDERFSAVDRPREREDLFENYLVDLQKKVICDENTNL
jgi:hypothetical protein